MIKLDNLIRSNRSIGEYQWWDDKDDKKGKSFVESPLLITLFSVFDEK